jgi:hypothetical protein
VKDEIAVLADAVALEIHVDPEHGFPVGFGAWSLAALIVGHLHEAGYLIVPAVSGVPGEVDLMEKAVSA